MEKFTYFMKRFWQGVMNGVIDIKEMFKKHHSGGSKTTA